MEELMIVANVAIVFGVILRMALCIVPACIRLEDCV